MKKMSRTSVLLSATLIGILGFMLGSFTSPSSIFSTDNYFELSRKYTKAFINIAKFYVDDVDTEKLTEAAIKGMLEELDPHSAYLPPRDAKLENQRFSGNFEGVGIEFQIARDTLMVVAPVFGGPSEKAGVQAGDKIIAIDDSSAIGITTSGVINKLRGPKGTKVSISIIRANVDEILKFAIIRDKIPQNSIACAKMLNNSTGYIYISNFIMTTHQELIKSIKFLKGQGMETLVLDLRSNPGGYLDQAIKVADEFLSQGKKIVYTLGRAKPQESAYSSPGGSFEQGALVVLINQGSASASEIVAGAIQDHDRGIIAGGTSFGKGLVQRPFELQDKSQIRLTISRYYTPSGRSIQRPYVKGEGGRKKYYAQIDKRGIVDELRVSATEDSARKLSSSLRGQPIPSLPIVQKDTIHPKFKTSKGRLVLGSGGITPDYFIFPDTASKYLINILAKSSISFNDYALHYLDNHPNLRKRKVKENNLASINKAIQKFDDSFQITDEIIKDFFKFIKKNGIEYDKEKVNAEKTFYQTQLKANIARNIWGHSAYLSMLLNRDTVLKKAKKLFKKAKEFAKKQ